MTKRAEGFASHPVIEIESIYLDEMLDIYQGKVSPSSSHLKNFNESCKKISTIIECIIMYPDSTKFGIDRFKQLVKECLKIIFTSEQSWDLLNQERKINGIMFTILFI